MHAKSLFFIFVRESVIFISDSLFFDMNVQLNSWFEFKHEMSRSSNCSRDRKLARIAVSFKRVGKIAMRDRVPCQLAKAAQAIILADSGVRRKFVQEGMCKLWVNS
jgi:hypothetical protein